MSQRLRGTAAVLTVALALAVPVTISGQQPQPSAPPADTAKPSPAPARGPQLDFSGVMFANYQYRRDRGASHGANKFDVERVYLTFKTSAGERASVRLTTDLFQQQSSGSDAYYKGWTLRAKYAYFQYDYLKRAGLTAVARLGLIHNVFIDHDESFWPRWIGTVATDRHGYFSSADAGLVSLITFPGRRGELYVSVVNGPGYTSRETDRFKDYGARLTLTPFANSGATFWRSLALTGWTYHGAVGSKFASGGAGQLGPIGSSLQRDRWGVFAGVKHPRLTLAAQYAARSDDGELGDNTAAVPRTVVDSSGHLVSAYVMARVWGGSKPVHLLARADQVTTNRSRGRRHRLGVGGLIWDFTSAASLAVDYQRLHPRLGSDDVARNQSWFVHLVARF